SWPMSPRSGDRVKPSLLLQLQLQDSERFACVKSSVVRGLPRQVSSVGLLTLAAEQVDSHFEAGLRAALIHRLEGDAHGLAPTENGRPRLFLSSKDPPDPLSAAARQE